MLRKCVYTSLALLLVVSVSLAADKNNKKKKGATVAGTVKAIDAAAGKVTVAVKVKKMTEEKDFTVGDAVKVVSFDGDKKTELAGKDGLKGVKIGEKIRVQTDENGNVVSLQVGTPPKKKKTNK